MTILLDFVHVLEYLWRAAWSFYDEGDPAAEAWVNDKARAVLDGRASTVAANVIPAGVPGRDAGAAWGVLTTVNQIGNAAGIAILITLGCRAQSSTTETLGCPSSDGRAEGDARGRRRSRDGGRSGPRPR